MSYEKIPGWSGFLWLYDRAVAEARDGDTIVEVGVAFGRSVAYLARQVMNSGKKIRIVAVDPWWSGWWQSPEDYPADLKGALTWGGEHSQFARDCGGPFSAFIRCMTTHAPEELERIEVMRCTSVEAAGALSSGLRSGECRCVLIDANHTEPFVKQDIEIWRPHVMRGGILAGDDYADNFPGVQAAVRANVPGYKTKGTTWWVDIP